MQQTINKSPEELFPDRRQYKNQFVIPVAENLYKIVKKSGNHDIFPLDFDTEFKKLSKNAKSFWYDYVEKLSGKYLDLNLGIHTYNNYCRTCLITDYELIKLTEKDLESLISLGYIKNKTSKWKSFCKILNYFAPVALKISGYEILRPEEEAGINESFIKRIARAIHTRYLHEVRNQKTQLNSDSGNMDLPYVNDFDSLPERIRYSNFDNAANIPAKLLAIGYRIRPVKKGFKPFALHLDEEEIETMSKIEHIRWSWEKRLDGWTFDKKRDDDKKTHPGLIPYEELSEPEKEKDRELVKLIPAFLQDIDYEAYPVSPNITRKLSYALKPLSSIHKILDHTRQLNEQIRSMVKLSPEVEEMIRIRNITLEEAITEVEESYNYAQHIQETFLPEDFTVREIFPDSFILFKPKDIVSGDFYFFNKKDNITVFAVADCTGHGIPGAMLSTLGYSILDQAVNEIMMTDPSLILKHLYRKIHRYLRSDSESTGVSDDMDIILCTLDTDTNLLIYAGVKNPLYRFTNGQLHEYRAQNYSGLDCGEDCQFLSKQIQLHNSDTLYLSTDGYPDQFGGQNHKKYSRNRLKDFLQTIQNCALPEQGDMLYEEIEKWREEKNEDQTDDIMILGIRL
jgi:serine phosphatase RsbU (regulator of sigma subunit)